MGSDSVSLVSAFLAGEIPFSGIVRATERALAAFPGGGDTLQDILEQAIEPWLKSNGYLP